MTIVDSACQQRHGRDPRLGGGSERTRDRVFKAEKGANWRQVCVLKSSISHIEIWEQLH